MYPCASVVATVVRSPRSEVSERPRAGKLGVGGVTFVELDAGPPQGGGIGGRRKQTLQLVSTERPHRPRLLLLLLLLLLLVVVVVVVVVLVCGVVVGVVGGGVVVVVAVVVVGRGQDLLVAAWNSSWPSKEASFLVVVVGGGDGDGDVDGVVVVVVVVVIVAYFTPKVSI